MIYLYDLIWVFVILFGIIGVFRGAAKELLVTVGVLVALFFTFLLESSVDFIGKDLKAMNNGEFLMIMRLVMLAVLILAGYQTPYRDRLPFKQKISANLKVEKLLGFVIGALNGFLIFGTIWFYLSDANYPKPLDFIHPPTGSGIDPKRLQEMLGILPPNWLKPPAIYFSIAIIITIVLVMLV